MNKEIISLLEPFENYDGEKKFVFFDLDGTAAEWRTSASLSDLYQKGYFSSLKPTEIATYANELAKIPEIETFSLSAYFPDSFAYEEKNIWIDQFIPNIDKEHRIFVPCGIDKASFVVDALRHFLTNKHVLVDDYTENLTGWHQAGGRAIKWLNGINGCNGKFQGNRTNSLFELNDMIFD